MPLPLDPEQSQQLATLLQYCREMGGMDFFRRPGEVAPSIEELASAVAQPAAQAAPSAPVTAASTSTPATLVLEPPSSMPRTANAIPVPPAFDPSRPPLPASDRPAALDAIRVEIGDCTRCPLAFEGRNKIVFGNGDPNAELMFVGEGPGADEDIQGFPFVGRGGQLLNNMIGAMGLAREQVYVANIVKCRPPKNRVPEPVEALTCTPFLFSQIGVVRPKLIVALGSTAATYLLATKASLSVLRGKIHECMGTRLIVTYHPAYLLRDPRQKAEAWKDLQMAMKFLGLTPPSRPQA